jgi:hypothetical protein
MNSTKFITERFADISALQKKNHTIINKEKGETMNSYKIAVTHDGLHAKPDVAGGLCME